MTHDELAQHFDAVALMRRDHGRLIGKLDRRVMRRWRIIGGDQGFAEKILYKSQYE